MNNQIDFSFKAWMEHLEPLIIVVFTFLFFFTIFIMANSCMWNYEYFIGKSDLIFNCEIGNE